MSWNSFVETGVDTDFQLYNLKKDPSQKNNLAKENPKKLAELLKKFEAIRGTEYSNLKKK